MTLITPLTDSVIVMPLPVKHLCALLWSTLDVLAMKQKPSRLEECGDGGLSPAETGRERMEERCSYSWAPQKKADQVDRHQELKQQHRSPIACRPGYATPSKNASAVLSRLALIVMAAINKSDFQ